MNIALGRKYRGRRGFLSALFVRNPVLVLGLDLPFIIVCSTTVRTAVGFGIEMFIIHMVTIAVALVTVRHLPLWLRTLVNVGAAFVMMTIARYVVTGIFPDISNYAGMYLYLMAVNGITIYQSTHITRKDKPLPVLAGAFMNAFAFSLTMALVSVFREWFGSGSIWGIPIPMSFRLSGLALPFSGFILMGFLLAFTKFFNKLLLSLSIQKAIREDARYTELNPK